MDRLKRSLYVQKLLAKQVWVRQTYWKEPVHIPVWNTVL